MHQFATQTFATYGLVILLTASQLSTASTATISTQPYPESVALQQQAGPEAHDQISSGLTAWEVGCGYAVSGMYCRMQRILFYAIAVFTFCFRFHSWLTASGVAYLTATSVVMATHSLALQFGTDIVPDCDSALSILLLFISGVTARTFLSFSPRVLRYRMKTAFVTTVALHIIYCVLCAYHFSEEDQKDRRHLAVKVCTSQGGCYDTCSTRVPGS